MTAFAKLTLVAVQNQVKDAGHVAHNVRKLGDAWVNPWGVNLIRKHPGEDVHATILEMDDGEPITVAETPRAVMNRLNKAMGGKE